MDIEQLATRLFFLKNYLTFVKKHSIYHVQWSDKTRRWVKEEDIRDTEPWKRYRDLYLPAQKLREKLQKLLGTRYEKPLDDNTVVFRICILSLKKK